MKEELITEIQQHMLRILDNSQMEKLKHVLRNCLQNYEVVDSTDGKTDKTDYLELFLSAKRIEGRSEKTLAYYRSIVKKMTDKIGKAVNRITTDDLRRYLSEYQEGNGSSKVTIDNIRRILSTFFGWLEDEDYIIKSPVRRIHKVKTGKTIKETYTDEELELMRDCCTESRDLAIIDMLASTGMRIGEMVLLNRDDVNFNERECTVLGKGDKERIVYFDALFVSLNVPHNRISIGGIEVRLREIGDRLGIQKVHPHKFRRTLATMAIDKGMPIEQLQHLLGHQRIDTTLHYAMVKESNVKLAHKKYLG